MQSEYGLHVQVVHFLRHALPKNSLVHHSPNEGRHHVQHRLRQTAMGMTAGWPDLEMFVHPSGFLAGVQPAGIFVELKSPRGRLSQRQAVCVERLKELGQYAAICRSVEDVAEFLADKIRLQANIQ